MAQRTALGKNFYLWHPANKPAINRKLLISAHGEQTMMRKSIAVPQGSDVEFLGPIGRTLMVETVTSYFQHRGVVSIDCKSGSIENYRLTKFQSAEERMGKNGKPFDETYRALYALNDATMLGMNTDVVTVRNRMNGVGITPTLEDLFSDLNAAGYRYRVYICHFCRHSFFDWKPAEHQATYF